MVKAMCTHGNVDQGTIVSGAFWHFAEYIALSVGNYNWEPNETDSTYTVTCSFEFPSIETLLLVRKVPPKLSQNRGRYAKSLVGGDLCVPDRY